MCNAKKLAANLSMIGQATRRQLDLPLVFGPGVTAETSNMPVPQAVFPKNDGLFLRPVDPADPAVGLEPIVGRWGLVPSNYRGSLKSIKFPCNNARSETMAQKWPFREAVARRRCIIPMTSFTEWTGPKGSKTAHDITAADGGLLFAAGLWEDSHPDEGPLISYTMVMTECQLGDDMWPGPGDRRFHDRQPVLLNRDRVRSWLDRSADFQPLLCALPRQSLRFDPPEPVAAAQREGLFS